MVVFNQVRIKIVAWPLRHFPSTMDHATNLPTDRTRSASSSALLFVGLLLIGLVFAEGQILPRIEGSAEPALSRQGPWAWSLLEPFGSAGGAALPVFLGIALLAGLAAAYALGLYLGRAHEGYQQAIVVVLIVTIFLNVLLVFALPIRQEDLFYYAFQGRMIARAHLNPYILPPRAIEADAWFPFVSRVWRDLPTGYGPVWLLITAGIDVLADRGGAVPDFIRTILALRVLFATANVVSACLIWLLLGNLAPERRLLGAIAYAWNPVVLLLGVDHNDGVMLVLALSGLWLHTRRHQTLAVAALTLSALIKYFTAPLLLAYLFWRWRASRDRRAQRYLAPTVSVILFLLALLPFDPPVAAVHFATYLNESGRLARVEQVPFEVLAILFAIVGIRVASLQSVDHLLRIIETGTLALFAYLAFLSRDWFPWYLTSALGLSALLGSWWLDVTAVAGVTWLLSLHGGTAYLAGTLRQILGLNVATSLALIAFAPALAVGAMGVLRRRLQISALPVTVGGLVFLAVATSAVELPLLGHWNETPVEADLGGGRRPGPSVVGTALEWDDWSWGTSVSQIGTPAGPAGPRSVCFTFASVDAAFFAHHPGFSTRGYTTLTFFAGPAGAPTGSLIVDLRGATGQSLGSVSLDGVQTAPGAAGWRYVNLPLPRLGAVDTVVSGVLIRPEPASVGKFVCLQDLSFR